MIVILREDDSHSPKKDAKVTQKPQFIRIMKPEDKDIEQIKREINKGGVHTATNPVNNYKQ